MLIAGNWKMHTDLSSAQALAKGVCELTGDVSGVKVAVCPPFVQLETVRRAVDGTAVQLGAQTMHAETEGAFTGSVSAPMLTAVGCTYVILGHSERRRDFGEEEASINAKVHTALEHGLIPIVCVGEHLEDRKAGRAREIVKDQIDGALADVNIDHATELVIAYEPVWAIGTGETATPEQAQEMHAFIHERLAVLLGEDLGKHVEVLYGGSMKPHNAHDLLSQPDVNGGLIGGASLKSADFAAIVEAGVDVMDAPTARP